MSSTDDANQVRRELSRVAQTMVMAGVEISRRNERRKLDELKAQQRQERERKKELLRGAPTSHKQRIWNKELGAGDAVALQYHDGVYTGIVETNPNKSGDCSVKFDDPLVSQTVGNTWHRNELKVRQQGHPAIKLGAQTQPESELSDSQKQLREVISQRSEAFVVGDVVHASDMDNIGTVVSKPIDGQVKVHFLNKEENKEATVNIDVSALTVIEPAEQTNVPASTEEPVKNQSSNSVASSQTAMPKLSAKQTVETSSQTKAEWQETLGRGDKVRTARGGIGTITSNPTEGKATVYFANQAKGTERETDISLKELTVIEPGRPELKASSKPFTVKGPGEIVRTVTDRTAIPGKISNAKKPVEVRRPDLPLIEAKADQAPPLKPDEAAAEFAKIKANLGPKPFNENQAAQHQTIKNLAKSHEVTQEK